MSIYDSWFNRQVIARTYSAGVHIGTLTETEDRKVVLANARRLWHWEGAFTLNEVASKGVSSTSRISAPIERVLLTEVIELLPVSAKAQETFNAINE